MGLITTKAILLKYHNYGESSRIFTFFTRDAGKVTLDAKGARVSRKRHFTTIDHLSYMTITFKENVRKKLERLSSINMIEPFFSLRAEIDTLSAALYFADLTSEFFKDHEVNGQMFDDLLAFLEKFNSGSFTLSDIVVFQLKVLGHAGLIPDMTTCIKCSKPFFASGGKEFSFSSNKGGFICSQCAPKTGRLKASLGTLKLLNISKTTEISKLKRIKFTKQSLNESLTVLSSFIDYNLNKRLRSYDYLRKLFKNKNVF